MPYRHSYIPNFIASDRSIPCSGMLRLRKADDLEDGSHIYTSGVLTKRKTDKTSIRVIVQDPPKEAKKFDEAAIVNLSSGFLAFGKASRAVTVYTLPLSANEIAPPKAPPKSSKTQIEDHPDLGCLWCSFVAVIQRLDGVKEKDDEASATWTVEVPIDGGSFKAIVEYGPRPVAEIDSAVKSFTLGDVAHFHAQWDGMDDKNSKTPVFILGSMSVVNIVDIITLATPASDETPSTSKKAATKGKTPVKPTTVIKKEKDTKVKRKGRESDDEQDGQSSVAEPEEAEKPSGGGRKVAVKATAGTARRASRSNITPRPNEPSTKRARVASP